MPTTIMPFAGWRYNPQQVPALDNRDMRTHLGELGQDVRANHDRLAKRAQLLE